MVHFRCFLDRNTFQWLRSLNSSGKYLYRSCYRKELCLIDGMRLVYAAIQVYQRFFFDCLSQNLNMLFFCLHQLFFVIQFFFFRSIPDIIVAYCIYVDMKVIAMKANIRSFNNNQIYGKVHAYMIYVYQIIILYKAICVTLLILIHIYGV